MYGHLTTPIVETAVASATYTADVNSAAYELRFADTISLSLKSDAGGGTTPTLDVAMQWTPDGGTTWLWAPIRFAQITTSASQQMITFKPSLTDEAAWHNAVAGTGGALAKNFACSRKVRFVFDVGGTSPSFANVIVRAIYQNRSL